MVIPLRRWVRRCHLLLALLTALVISVVGLSGSVYLFAPELSAALRPELYQVATPAQKPAAMPASAVVNMVSQLEQQHGKQLESLQWPYASRQTFLLKWQQDPAWYFVEPARWQLQTDQGAYLSPFFDWVYELHSNLLLGEPGRYLTAGASLLFALFCLSTGVYLWWPAKGWRGLTRAFTLRRSNSAGRFNRKRFNYDLHAVSGAWFSLPLLLMGLTGAFYVFEGPMQRSLDWLLQSTPAPADFWQKRFAYAIPADQQRLSSAQAVARLYQLQPAGMQPRNLWHNTATGGTYTLGYQQHNEISSGPQHRIFIQLEPYRGSVLKVADPSQLPLASRLSSQYLQPMHFGEFAGLPSRIIWCIGGLVPLLLTVSGTLIYLNRRRRH